MSSTVETPSTAETPSTIGTPSTAPTPRPMPTEDEHAQYESDKFWAAQMAADEGRYMDHPRSKTQAQKERYWILRREKEAGVIDYESKYGLPPPPPTQDVISAMSNLTLSQATGHLQQPFGQRDSMHVAYHEAMCATATDMPNPPYNQEFGWWDVHGNLVKNPQHPYWKGRALMKHIKATDALHLAGPWRHAHIPGQGAGYKLQHPFGVVDERSYFAGIRHEDERIDAILDGLSLGTDVPQYL